MWIYDKLQHKHRLLIRSGQQPVLSYILYIVQTLEVTKHWNYIKKTQKKLPVCLCGTNVKGTESAEKEPPDAVHKPSVLVMTITVHRNLLGKLWEIGIVFLKKKK